MHRKLEQLLHRSSKSEGVAVEENKTGKENIRPLLLVLDTMPRNTLNRFPIKATTTCERQVGNDGEQHGLVSSDLLQVLFGVRQA